MCPSSNFKVFNTFPGFLAFSYSKFPTASTWRIKLATWNWFWNFTTCNHSNRTITLHQNLKFEKYGPWHGFTDHLKFFELVVEETFSSKSYECSSLQNKLAKLFKEMITMSSVNNPDIFTLLKEGNLGSKSGFSYFTKFVSSIQTSNKIFHFFIASNWHFHVFN